MPAPSHAILLVVDAETVTCEPYPQLANRLAAQTGADVRCCTVAGLRVTLAQIAAGALAEVSIVPLVVGAAHVAVREIAALQAWAQARWPATSFRCTAVYAESTLLASLLARQFSATLAAAPDLDRKQTTAIVLAPRGDDGEANAELASAVRRFWERSAVGWAELAFLNAGTPDLAMALRRSQPTESSPAIVLPITLFADAAYRQIASQVAVLGGLLGAPLVSVEGASATIAMRLAQGEASANHGHDHGLMLPARYHNTAPVSAAPMAAADLTYDHEGRVAWDKIWGDFCDLALAGGPPHRGVLLEPASPEAIRADPAKYGRVIEELARGLRMVSGLDVLTDTAPGWIGLRCHNEAMALWLLRAILVENVAARREGSIVFLPAGPQFRLEHEIKNVVTVVAKTYHYWST